MICVNCALPVQTLFTEYGKGHIQLTQCQKCRLFADKYVELDGCLVCLDLILHKPAVIRHLLFNRLGYTDYGLHPFIARLLTMLILFDVYVKWYRLEKMLENVAVLPKLFNYEPGPISLGTQYFYLLSFCVVEYVGFFLGSLLITWWWLHGRYAIFKYNYVIMAIILGRFSKLLSITTIVWAGEEDWIRMGLLELLVWSCTHRCVCVVLECQSSRGIGVLLGGLAMKVLLQCLFVWTTGSLVPWIMIFL